MASWSSLPILARAFSIGYSQVISRSSNTSWTATQILFRDGPYLAQGSSGTTLTPSSATGAITITASSTNGVNATAQNNGQGFLATDIGRPVRMQVTTEKYGWALITGWISPTQVNAVVKR